MMRLENLTAYQRKWIFEDYEKRQGSPMDFCRKCGCLSVWVEKKSGQRIACAECGHKVMR